MEVTRSANIKVRAGALNPDFERLAERTFKFFLANDPVRASWLGIHGRNDAQLPDRSVSAQDAELAGMRALHREFEDFDPHHLSPEQEIELALGRGFLGAQVALTERRPAARLMPQLYLEDCAGGLYCLLLRAYAPPEVRAKALLGRLRAIPGLLEQGKQNLEAPPALFTEAAVLIARGMEDLLKRTLRDFVQSLSDADLRHQCERTAAEAWRAVEAYNEFLLGTLMTRSRGEFRVGKVTFNRLLRDLHRIPFDADELVVLGEKVYHETLREIRATAARIRPGYNWSRLLQQLKEEHPSAHELVGAYASAVKTARKFTEERKLVALPPADSLEVVPTPAFARPFFPYVGYIAPGPYEEAAQGLLWVCAPDSSDSPERQETDLLGHSRPAIQVLAVHEAYPGHHVQSFLAQRADRKLRTLFTTPLLSEGWAFYCEELMYTQGFFSDDKVRLLQLRDQLWRACRVIVDVGLHTGKMSFNDAASFLVRKAKLERHNALAEVRRYCEYPTQPMSYVVGKLLIQELREDYRASRGENFTLRGFHDELLRCGSLPIELVRQEMGVPRRAGEKEVLRVLTHMPRPAAGVKRRTRRVAARVARSA